ncbi:unnamed protein product [Phytomonas sp. EM1]|nr:unnamed protein product [Phytomonas sp. EM1]|eukprot:CCW60506.1 unnamed protein product [Phytomonas sp. isolate EM1]
MSVYRNSLGFLAQHSYQSGISQEAFNNDPMAKSENGGSSVQPNGNMRRTTLVTSPTTPPRMVDPSSKQNSSSAAYQTNTSFLHRRYLFSPSQDEESTPDILKHQQVATSLGDPNQFQNCAGGEEGSNAFLVSTKELHGESKFSTGLNSYQRHIKRNENSGGSLGLANSRLSTLRHRQVESCNYGQAVHATFTQSSSSLHDREDEAMKPKETASSAPRAPQTPRSKPSTFLSAEEQHPPGRGSNRMQENMPYEALHAKYTESKNLASDQVLFGNPKDLQHQLTDDRKAIQANVPYAASFDCQENQHDCRKEYDYCFRRQSIVPSPEKTDTPLSCSYCIPHVAISPPSPPSRGCRDPVALHLFAEENSFGKFSGIHHDTMLVNKDSDLACGCTPEKIASIRKADDSGNKARFSPEGIDLNSSRIPQKGGSLDKGIENACDTSSLSLLADYLCSKVRWLEEENESLRRCVLQNLDGYGGTAGSFPSRSSQRGCESSHGMQSRQQVEGMKAVAHGSSHPVEIAKNGTSKDQHGNLVDDVAFRGSLSTRKKETHVYEETTSRASKISAAEHKERQSIRLEERSPPFQASPTCALTSYKADLHSPSRNHDEKSDIAAYVPTLNMRYNTVHESGQGVKKSTSAFNASYVARDPYKRQDSAFNGSWKHDLGSQGFIFGGGSAAAEGPDDYGAKCGRISTNEVGPESKRHITPSRSNPLSCNASNEVQPPSRLTHEDISRLDAYYSYLYATHQYLSGLHNAISSTGKKLQGILSATLPPKKDFSFNRDTDFKTGATFRSSNEPAPANIEMPFLRYGAEGVPTHAWGKGIKSLRASPRRFSEDFRYSSHMSEKDGTCARFASNDHFVCEHEFSRPKQLVLFPMSARSTTKGIKLISRSSTRPPFGLCSNAHNAHWTQHTDASCKIQPLTANGAKATPMFQNKRGISFQGDVVRSSEMEDKPVGTPDARTMTFGRYPSFWQRSTPLASQTPITAPLAPITHSSKINVDKLTDERTTCIRNVLEGDHKNCTPSLEDQDEGEGNIRKRFEVSPCRSNRTPQSSRSCMKSCIDPYSHSPFVNSMSAGKRKANGRSRFSLHKSLVS